MSILTHYEVLEVAENATTEEIRLAFRAFALKHHPDSISATGGAALSKARAHFSLGAEAYRILSNADLRKEYNQMHGINAPRRSEIPGRKRPSLSIPPPGGAERVSFRARPFYEEYEKCARRGDLSGAKLNLGFASKYDTSGFLADMMEEIEDFQKS